MEKSGKAPNITSKVTKLPSSCKSVMEHMEDELKREDEEENRNMETSCEFQVADLPESCERKIHEFERELNKQGYWNVALVAYQMKNHE
ncbi:hypothetical protein [Novisyntrophococcus fermenticellae]|uniref:hypothetical protein n=1 Tax=Novisyntrophococcus fermenticellae TaxID=2068655 RepID=UPI001E338B7E|nr:hypothetical protein [Novisyntrophococcus fermenticellae]